ncbi:MAG: host-nuclease inhibitor protein Gam [Candidatus Glassbacteria bacterium]|nr:host-nuclease inhibitor protein Gam [Candidatus Glassbacteria bacterium]
MGTKTTKIKSEAADYPVPQSREEAVEAIAEIGRRQRERERIQAAMNDELAVIRQKFEEEAAPHNDTIKGMSTGVQIWCEANRETLTNDGKVKTANLSSGEIRWRIRPPKVSVRAADTVLKALKELKLTRFIRVKEEVNKEAILAELETVKHLKGITITQGEDFVIIPFETELEEVV